MERYQRRARGLRRKSRELPGTGLLNRFDSYAPPTLIHQSMTTVS